LHTTLCLVYTSLDQNNIIYLLEAPPHTNFTLREALSALMINANLAILTADGDDDSVIINTSECSQKFGDFL
jgi:hypothetical protein